MDSANQSDIDNNSSATKMRFSMMSLICFIQDFHILLSKLFYKLGYLIGEKPNYFIIVPVFITLFGLTGVQQITYEADPEILFTPTNGKGWQEREVAEALFQVNSSGAFDVFRTPKRTPYCTLIISAKDGGEMLRMKLFEEIKILDEAIRSVRIVFDQSTYTYTDVCAKIFGSCTENNLLDLYEHIPEIENGNMLINYPVMLSPLVVPFYFRGVTVNESEGILTEAKAVSLSYWFRFDNKGQEERSLAFEREVLKLLDKTEFQHIKVDRFASSSLIAELDRNILYVAPFIAIMLILMFTFTIFSLLTTNWVRSKVSLGALGITSAILASGCSFGFLMYFGVPFIGINLAAPFLMLGIGIDDMFVVLSAWHRTKIQDPVPLRLAKTYSEAAVSITITSLTSMLSFFIGIFTPFPAVRIFCTYISLACFVTYVWFITFFGGCLALSGGLESKGKHNITCKPVVPRSKAENLGCCYRLWCAGGYNPEDPWNPKDNKEHIIKIFFRDYLAIILNNMYIKVLVISMFLLYLSGAIYGCTQVNEGLKMSNLVLDDSYLAHFFKAEDDYPREYSFPIQVIINEKLNYSDPKTRREMQKLQEKFESLENTASHIFSQSWLKRFYRFLDRRDDNITTERQFIKILKNEYLTVGRRSPEFLDIVFNEDESEIIASRFIIYSRNIHSSNDEKNLMLNVRQVAQEAPFSTEVFNLFFIHFDQYVMVKQICIQTIAIASVVMMIVSLVFIPNPLCSLCVAFSILSIETGVIGYMSLWEINLDIISIINLIMCVGFSVDFSAHISYSYLTSKAPTPEGKVKDCLYSMGLPILQGGLSTIIGVSVLGAMPSYIFRSFFKINFLVITFGLMHSLILLPVLLSIFGPATRKSKVEEVPSNLQPNQSKHYVVNDDIIIVESQSIKSKINFEEKILDKDLGIGSSGSSSQSSQPGMDNISEGSSSGSFATAGNPAKEVSDKFADTGNHNIGFLPDEEESITT